MAGMFLALVLLCGVHPSDGEMQAMCEMSMCA